MSLVAVVLIAVSGLVFRGWPGRFSESTLRLASAANDISPVRTKCHFETKDPGPLDKSCTLGDGTEPAIIVYGDSHGIELSFALSKIAPVHHNSVREFTASACSSVLNFAVASTPKCEERNATVIELLASLPPTTVILAPGWENASGPNAETYLKGFSAVLDSLHRAHHRVIVIGPAPIHPGGIPLPETLARMSLLGIDANSYRFAANVTGLLSADRAGADFAALHGAQYLAITPLGCEEANCRGAIDNKPLYYDSKHLSERGAELVVDRMLASAIWPNLIDQLPLADRS